MPKPFVIKVRVPLVNYAEPGARAEKEDAAILVANALKLYQEQHPEFFDQGLELEGHIEVQDGSDRWRTAEDLADV